MLKCRMVARPQSGAPSGNGEEPVSGPAVEDSSPPVSGPAVEDSSPPAGGPGQQGPGGDITFNGKEVTYTLSGDVVIMTGMGENAVKMDLSELAPNDVIRFTTITGKEGREEIDSIMVIEKVGVILKEGRRETAVTLRPLSRRHFFIPVFFLFNF